MLAIAAAAALPVGARAPSAPYPDPSWLAQWEAMREHPDLRKSCKTSLMVGTAIAKMVKPPDSSRLTLGLTEADEGSLTALHLWEFREEDKLFARSPSSRENFYQRTGMFESLAVQLLVVYKTQYLKYNHVPGGFPQFAYRSCLKRYPLLSK
jgi:hypothetical protein